MKCQLTREKATKFVFFSSDNFEKTIEEYTVDVYFTFSQAQENIVPDINFILRELIRMHYDINKKKEQVIERLLSKEIINKIAINTSIGKNLLESKNFKNTLEFSEEVKGTIDSLINDGLIYYTNIYKFDVQLILEKEKLAYSDNDSLFNSPIIEVW